MQQSKTPPHSDSKLILIVDDDGDYRDLLARAFEKAGYHSILARDGVDALNLVRTNDKKTFAAVWTDLNMPRMDGFQLACALRGLRYNFPIAITSGDLEGSQYSQTDIARVTPHYIPKTNDFELARILLRELLGGN